MKMASFLAVVPALALALPAQMGHGGRPAAPSLPWNLWGVNWDPNHTGGFGNGLGAFSSMYHGKEGSISLGDTSSPMSGMMGGLGGGFESSSAAEARNTNGGGGFTWVPIGTLGMPPTYPLNGQLFPLLNLASGQPSDASAQPVMQPVAMAAPPAATQEIPGAPLQLIALPQEAPAAQAAPVPVAMVPMGSAPQMPMYYNMPQMMGMPQMMPQMMAGMPHMQMQPQMMMHPQMMAQPQMMMQMPQQQMMMQMPQLQAAPKLEIPEMSISRAQAAPTAAQPAAETVKA